MDRCHGVAAPISMWVMGSTEAATRRYIPSFGQRLIAEVGRGRFLSILPLTACFIMLTSLFKETQSISLLFSTCRGCSSPSGRLFGRGEVMLSSSVSGDHAFAYTSWKPTDADGHRIQTLCLKLAVPWSAQQSHPLSALYSQRQREVPKGLRQALV